MLRTYAVVFCALCGTGCATQSTPPVIQGCLTWEQQQQAGAANLSAVSVLSPDLARVIGVQEVITDRTATGMAVVQARVYNCSDADVVLLMRTHFSGARGESEPPSAWKNVFVPPRGRASYAESAISGQSSRVNVDIHDANRGQSQWAPGQVYTAPLPGQPVR